MNEQAPKKSDREYYLFALRIAGDFGATIALPVVLFVILGQYLDGKRGHGILYTVLGFVLAAAVSAKILYKKAKKYGEEYKKL